MTKRKDFSRKPEKIKLRGTRQDKLRPPGQRIREICATLQIHGPMTATQIQAHLPHIKRSNVVDYCVLGVFDGYLTDQKRAGPNNSSIWTAKPNWAGLMDAHKKQPEPEPEPGRGDWAGVASVFQLGQISV